MNWILVQLSFILALTGFLLGGAEVDMFAIQICVNFLGGIFFFAGMAAVRKLKGKKNEM